MWNQKELICIIAPSGTTCVTLGKSWMLSNLQITQLYNGDNHTYFLRLNGDNVYKMPGT